MHAWPTIFVCVKLQELDTQKSASIATELCGFFTIVSGTFLLHKTRDLVTTPSTKRHNSEDASPKEGDGEGDGVV